MFTISPSLYSADIMKLGEVVKNVDNFEHLHIDIDDGNFVRGISFGMNVVEGVCKSTNVPVDVHLEVLNPIDYIDKLCATDVKLITAHVEQLPFPSLFISRVHNGHKSVGLALNVKTPVSYIKPYINDIDLILLVSVEADEEGLLFRKGILDKVREIKSIRNDIPVWMDGGINKDNLKDVVQAGTDGIVLGRAIFNSDNPSKAYTGYLQMGRKYEEIR